MKHLDKSVVKRIIDDLRDTLSMDPNWSEPISGQFKDLRKLRVGDHRVIYSRTK